ncbi:MAG: endopeptidase La [gamma proteobacterium symbiont of Bathyaustriella thionipta]|nr:endopeptidase La [gamma proteobacterium symbiont of Bathyaustriella thionipta]MCU7949455.1 endopeptidase La [gamma proteobacterium symbiont of Bathyaustriella thionipta]MCU7951953.1 endopeptidase La [gamma proteobacterium symbiont of Bathyaustriella thionipta]MCU7956042.1 endopeptidase La [gamma proteobacterium symbiont of Bathyaustriella thionipta]MCU7965926.1 endopeptidase La [gamma proteobacterium symbiont of Bathyaustriella thionipta]
MENENKISKITDTTQIYPVLPLRDVVVYPHMVIPLYVGREKSINALEAAMEEDKKILLIAQKNASEDDPKPEDINSVGTIASILRLLKLPDGTVKVLVEGDERAQIENLFTSEDYYTAQISIFENIKIEDREADVLTRTVMNQFDQYVKMNDKVPPEILSSLSSIEDPSRLADTIAAHMPLKIEEKQVILEISDVRERLEHLLAQMESEIDILQVEKRIRGRVKQQMEKSQREYYLNEQMKAIQKELNDIDDVPNELEEIENKIKNLGLSVEAKKKGMAELNKLKMMSPMSAEASVVRNYLEWLTNVPWKKRSKVRHDLTKAEAILEEDHYGLEKVKERILEYLAVQQRMKKLKGPILCLVGPPGVGKTSLGQSIARATNRKFTRMSLGGVRDEAEIRGHRRTYIGSMPGKIIQNMSKVEVKNPFFLLDEIDKMAMDMRGDPSSALLEVLDPEQNNTFNDHYMGVDYDLSEVMFIATSNSMNIPGPLLDRMEVIRLAGYTEDEKLNIVSRYLIPKQLKNNGLNGSELSISQGAIRDIIRYYTREAGVRSIEREVAKIARKVVKEILLDKKTKKISVTSRNVEKYLGVRRYRYGNVEEEDQVGQVVGLAWTEVGGEILTIETAVMPGKGKNSVTGQLGDVMKESIQAAMSVVRSRSDVLGISHETYETKDIHIHVPEGAIPKDGPSAGIGMCTALVSALTEIPVKADVAMTGEITLRGEVLPIGGLKEKLLAALRSGIQTVVIPEENRKDLVDLPKNIVSKLDIKPVQWIDEVLQIALVHAPVPIKVTKESTKVKSSKKSASIRAH